jgi:hypothetical protein
LALLGLLVGSLLGLSGCGHTVARVGYEQGPRLVSWWLDGFADFDEPQTQQVQKALRDWFTWHRQTQLPEYAGRLASFRSELAAPEAPPFTPQRACTWLDEVQVRTHRAWQAALPDIARVARSLTTEQLEQVQRGFDRRNREYQEEHVEASEAKRLRERTNAWRKNYEYLYGRLNPAQEALLTEAAARLGHEPAQFLAEAQSRQQAVLSVLRELSRPAAQAAPGTASAPSASAAGEAERSAQAQAEKRIGALLGQVGTVGGWGSPAWRQMQLQRREAHCALFAQMHQAAGPTGRENAGRELAGWEQELKTWAAER